MSVRVTVVPVGTGAVSLVFIVPLPLVSIKT